MTQLIKSITAVLTLVVATSFATQVNADEYRHIDQLAQKIQRYSKQLKNEVRHYRHTPEYNHLVNDVNNVYRLATHIHDVTHFEGNLFHLQSDLAELDREFHHLESVFDRIEHNAAYGNGHVHGSTAHVKRLLNNIEDSIHHITVDVQILRAPRVFHQPVYRPVYRQPVYQQPTCRVPTYNRPSHGGHGGHGGIGFSIGGGSSKIHIRF
jgi:hypothetical protein